MEYSAKQSLDVAIDEIINSYLLAMHTILIGEVTEFNAAEQTLSVQPVNKRKMVTADMAEPLPIITDVPIVWPGAGDYWVTFDIPVGSAVLLLCAERNISVWMEEGGIVDPADPTKFDLSDAIAIPCLNHKKSVLSTIDSDAITIRNRDNDAYVKLSGTKIEIKNGNGSVVLESNGKVKINNHLTVDP